MTSLEGTIELGLRDAEGGEMRAALPGDFKDTAKLEELRLKLVDVQAAVAAVEASLPDPSVPRLVESRSTSKGYEQITLSAEVSSLTIPANATQALVVASADVRWRDDATNPTATTGYPLPAMTELHYDGDQLASLVFFGTATLDIHYFA